MHRRMLGWPGTAAMILLLSACGGDAPEPPADAPPSPPAPTAEPSDVDPLAIDQADIAPELGVDLSAMTRLPSGVYVQDLVEGSGDVVRLEDRVEVRYTGWLFSGQEFDGTEGDETSVFPLSGLIPGWQEGIPGMREGGTRRLVIPYPLAYGEQRRSDVIGPRSHLIFDVEVVQVVEPAAQQADTTGG